MEFGLIHLLGAILICLIFFIFFYLVYLGLFYKVFVEKDKFGPIHVIHSDFIGEFWKIGAAFVFRIFLIYSIIINSSFIDLNTINIIYPFICILIITKCGNDR